MKKTINYTLIFLGLAISWYIIISYILVELNPIMWETTDRTSHIVFTIGTWVITILIIESKKL